MMQVYSGHGSATIFQQPRPSRQYRTPSCHLRLEQLSASQQDFEPSLQNRTFTPHRGLAREDSDTLPVHFLAGGIQTLDLSIPPHQRHSLAPSDRQRPKNQHLVRGSVEPSVFGHVFGQSSQPTHPTTPSHDSGLVEHKRLVSCPDKTLEPPAKRQKPSGTPLLRPLIYTSNIAPLQTHRKANSLPTQPSQGDLRELHASRQHKTRSLHSPVSRTTPPRTSSLANRDDATWQRPPVPPKDPRRPSISIVLPDKVILSRPRQHRSPSAPAPVSSTLNLFPSAVPVPQTSRSALSTPTSISFPPIIFSPTFATGSVPSTPMTTNMSFSFSQGSSGSASTDPTTSCFEDWDEGISDQAGIVGFMRRSFGRERSGSHGSSQKPSLGRNRKRKRGALFACFGWNGSDEEAVS